ncbi:2OG-Fe(II) oxygenase [Sandaracinus amylolyticus]|uniref:2OG-Fe(II)-dependent halogenase WelO5 family protein n=1 Tax=Sandaracinus amylolyticus TaxID=927083 RepID=UPI001F429BD5|nr:2OG-Fe(II) oxygenase [Sandaracinus amylolyticus]UJR84374.1 Hypothetical protein I5071_64530 [Sandaracinus amylolyticus]
MVQSEQQQVGAPTNERIRELFSRWGLNAGREVVGFTFRAAELSHDRVVGGPQVLATFVHESTSVGVRLWRAGEAPRFKRVGEIDLAHDPVDPALGRGVVALLDRLVAWLKHHDDGAALATLLDGAPRSAPEPAPSEAFTSSQPYVVVHEAPPLDPAKQAPPDRPVIPFDFIDVADLHRYPDALREIYAGKRGGLVIRGVYSKEEMARVVGRLERSQERFPLMHLPANQRSYFLGLCLEGGDPELTEYLDAATRFREETLPVFEGMAPFEQRVETLFRSMSGGRRVQLAHYGDGRPYTPATIRILPPGGQLAPHCGNEMYRRPSYRHLNSFVDDHDQLSFFLTLQEPEAGGGLIIYSLKWANVGSEHILSDERSNVGAILHESQWQEVRPGAGDVLIFDGGRYLHRVDWVRGPRTRWTMGGFLMFDRPGDTVLYFA